MLTDYKTPRITQNDDDSWTVVLRIYEGDITTEDEPDVNDPRQMVSVTRYRRTGLLRTVEMSFPAIPEQALHGRLRAELATDRTRQPVEEQRD